MMIYYIIIIIILLIIIYLLKKTIFEKFNGTHPNTYYNSWVLGDVIEKYNGSCNTGGDCYTKYNDYGHYNDNCDCISSKNKTTIQSISSISSISSMSPISSISTISTEEDDYIPPIIDNSNCIQNQDFSAYCKNNNDSTYGVKNIIPCNSSTSEVICEKNYIGGTKYESNILTTPCLNKSDDFDTWCRYYTNNSQIPDGYNVNSIGSRTILKGIEGDCYLNTGIPNTNSARAICDFNNIETIPRLEPVNTAVNYNKFTKCLKLNDDGFVKECKTLFTGDTSKVLATQIMGYDCNPGYARAKCVKSSNDTLIFNSDFYNQIYTTPHTDLTKSCNNICS